MSADALRQRAAAQGLSWTAEEAQAVHDLVAGICDGLEQARDTIEVADEEPAIFFRPAGAAS